MHGAAGSIRTLCRGMQRRCGRSWWIWPRQLDHSLADQNKYQSLLRHGEDRHQAIAADREERGRSELTGASNRGQMGRPPGAAPPGGLQTGDHEIQWLPRNSSTDFDRWREMSM